MNEYTPRISDEAVEKATGKTWNQWFQWMENVSLETRSHKEIAEAVLAQNAPAWWAQKIAVEFERVKGLRKVNESKDGFEVSIRKTCQSPARELFDHTVDLFDKDERIQFRKVRKGKHFSCDWLTDDSRLAVRFYAKDKNKTQIVIQHEALPNELDVAIMRNYWKERLQQMEAL